MPIRHIHIFQDCGWAFEPLENDSGETIGQALVIFDNKNPEAWKFPLSTEELGKLGQKALGIGSSKVHTSNVVDLEGELHRHGGRKK